MDGANYDFLDELENIAGKNDKREARRRTRGLPDEKARLQLATTYMSFQSKHWPDLVKAGILPKAPDYAEMAEHFRRTFETKQWVAPKLITPALWLMLGIAYLRYSDSNSNPRSLDQQLINILDKARQLNIFIPWQYVFADAAVTGTIAARHGYQLAKRLIQSKAEAVNVLLIDELGRASRDAIEALGLGRIIDSCHKRMICASDSFDSKSPTSKLQLHLYAMLHEFFVDQLREKVRRGMDDAFALGKNIYDVAVGYKFVDLLDEHGQIVVDDDDRKLKKRVVDEQWSSAVVDAYQKYDQCWSIERIVRHFNKLAVAGRKNWSTGDIIKLLERELYAGFEYYRKTYQVKDPTTGKVQVIQRPSEEWKRREVPELQIVPLDLWERVQARRRLSREVYSKQHADEKRNRALLHPKSLVRPYCAHCNSPMILGRSGKYASFFCDNGRTGKHGCKFRGYKSARIIDNAVLEQVAQSLFNDDFMERIVVEANFALKDTSRPKATVNVAAIEATIRKKTRAIEVITRQLDDADDTQNLQPVFERVAMLQAEITTARDQLAMATKVPEIDPVPITIGDVKRLLSDLRGLLQEDIGTAAPILASLTGPVMVSKVQSKSGEPEWHGQFTLNAVPALLFLAVRQKCPTASTWEYLSSGGWTIGYRQQVSLEHIEKHVQIAAQVKSLADHGLKIEAIARRLGTTWNSVREALFHLRRESVAAIPIISASSPQKHDNLPLSENEAKVIELRKKSVSFAEIARQLKIASSTASRIFQRCTGQFKSRYRRLPKSVFDSIEKNQNLGMTVAENACASKCSENTVRRYCRELRYRSAS